MCRGDDVWFVRLSVPAGRYECAFEVDGILYPGGMALVRSDYIELPPQVLHALALTHTCLCQTHKWN